MDKLKRTVTAASFIALLICLGAFSPVKARFSLGLTDLRTPEGIPDPYVIYQTSEAYPTEEISVNVTIFNPSNGVPINNMTVYTNFDPSVGPKKITCVENDLKNAKMVRLDDACSQNTWTEQIDTTIYPGLSVSYDIPVTLTSGAKLGLIQTNENTEAEWNGYPIEVLSEESLQVLALSPVEIEYYNYPHAPRKHPFTSTAVVTNIAPFILKNLSVTTHFDTSQLPSKPGQDYKLACVPDGSGACQIESRSSFAEGIVSSWTSYVGNMGETQAKDFDMKLEVTYDAEAWVEQNSIGTTILLGPSQELYHLDINPVSIISIPDID